MEEKLNQSPQKPEEEQVPQEPYRPRPWWQVWGARILLVIFILLVIMYYVNIARGGEYCGSLELTQVTASPALEL